MITFPNPKFTSASTWEPGKPWPTATLVLNTKNSVYCFFIEGGGWSTGFRLGMTTNETIARYRSYEVDFGGALEQLLSDLLYGRTEYQGPLHNLGFLIGRPFEFDIIKRSGMYGMNSEKLGHHTTTKVVEFDLLEGHTTHQGGRDVQ